MNSHGGYTGMSFHTVAQGVIQQGGGALWAGQQDPDMYMLFVILYIYRHIYGTYDMTNTHRHTMQLHKGST